MIADMWTSSPAATAAVWAAYEHSTEQEKHSEAQWLILNDFDPFLTDQNSKFDMGTWNLAKIKIVEQKKSYNFHFGRKLIWGSDQGEKHSRTRLKQKLLCELD